MDETPPASEDTKSVATAKFLDQVSTIFKSSTRLDFPDSHLQVTRSKRCILTWNTPQDDSCPGHILEWDDTNPDHIIVTSSQYSKTIPARMSNSPRAIRFKIPTEIDCGMRQLMCNTMMDLVVDAVLQEKAGIKSVRTVLKTPREAVWHLTRAEEKQE